jgi:hypothetical protein
LGAALQNPADGAEQFVPTHGLAQGRGRAQGNRRLLGVDPTGEGDDRDAGDVRLLQLDGPELPAVHHRHHEIQQHQVPVAVGLQLGERLLPVLRHGRVITRLAQHLGQDGRQIGIVVDDQDAALGAAHRIPSSRGCRGNSTMKVEPAPGSLLTPMFPPWASTTWRVMYRPSPRPP